MRRHPHDNRALDNAAEKSHLYRRYQGEAVLRYCRAEKSDMEGDQKRPYEREIH